MATDYYELRIQGLHQTEYNECVSFFKGDNLTAADYFVNAVDLVNSWIATIKPLWLAVLPSSYQLLRLTAKKASAGGGGGYSAQFAFGTAPGTVSGGAASQQLCPCIRLIPPMGIKTAGRLFMPAIAESQVGGNAPTAGWSTDINTLMDQLITPFGVGSIQWNLVVYSRKNQVFSEVVAYDSSPIIGFQRRRQRSPL